MEHTYNNIIDILSESINLTDSIPMAREGLIEDFEPIFADDYSVYNSPIDSYQMLSNELINSDMLNLELDRTGYLRQNYLEGRYHNRRSSRRANSSPHRNVMFCAYERTRQNTLMLPNSISTPINLSNSSTQPQPTLNNIQIDISSESENETEEPHRRPNRDRYCNKRQEPIIPINQLPRDEAPQRTSEQTGSTSYQENENNLNQQMNRNASSDAIPLLSDANHETNEITCDCSECLPENNCLHNKRKHVEKKSKTCKKRYKKHCRTTTQSNHEFSNDPIPGPSGISSNLPSNSHQIIDSSDSEDEVPTTSNVSDQRTQSDVLTAPHLQLDCFSDSSSDSSNDVIAIETPNLSSNPTTTTTNFYNRNSSNSTEGVQNRFMSSQSRIRSNSVNITSPIPIRPLMSMNAPDLQNDVNRCFYNQNYQYSQNHRNNYYNNSSRYHPDPRAPNAPDFARNSVFNSSNSNYTNNSTNNNTSGQGRSFGRWLNRGENYYRRRFYNNMPRSSSISYIPHQRLWHQQHFVQEMYRRFMTNNYDDGGRYNDNNGFNMNYNPQSFNPHHWHRRGYPVYPTPHSSSYPMRLFHTNFHDDFSAMYVPPLRRYPNRGASQETIENNTLSYKFLPVNESFDSEKCSICLSPFEVDTFVRRLPCMHFYHRECIEQWLQLNSTCPICRIDIKTRNT